MESSLYLVFVGVSIAVIVIPGPSILLIVSNGLQFGAGSGVATVAGTSAAMLIQLGVAMAGLTSLATIVSDGLGVARWLGIAYLCYLGMRRWQCTVPVGAFEIPAARRNRSAFLEGFLVSLANPTTMLFFIAFFPQFMNDAAPPVRQLLTMSVTFWALALCFDLTYAGLAARIGHALQDPRRALMRNRLSGAILVVAAAALALARA